ncbi:MAG: MCE family protein [Thermoleophilaceae bacterium]|nr:MCE family protein [Thermoleophilaceae bacterium]
MSALGRVAALAAVLAAVVAVTVLFFGSSSGSGYEVRAVFQHGGQLVKGSQVEIAGTPVGSVKSFQITDDGQAEVRFSVEEDQAPLPQGTRALIRAGSQSSAHNRFIDLHLPSENGKDRKIADGGVIDREHTTTLVSFDQFFAVFDQKTRRSLRGFFKGNSRVYNASTDPRGKDANAGLRYLNASLGASDRLFDELRADPPVLERFLVDSSRLVTTLSSRREDLSELVQNLNGTTRALGSQKEALAELIGRFPDFLRTANTTYVNLRGTLDELEPFVEASKPVAKKLGPYVNELRPFARDARPTVRRLSQLVSRKGDGNDLRELGKTYPALAEIAVETKERNGKQRRGAFPEATEAFKNSAPIIAHGRPYTVDFVGWMDDFSHTGAYDALGSFSRAQVYLNTFTVSEGGALTPVPNVSENFKALAKVNQFKRCPGASEEPAADGSNVYTEEQQKELDCRESDRATGPKK